MWLNYLPDAICFYRMGASISALVFGKHPLVPWLFSTALISDLFDGYFFRKYTAKSPNWRRWNPLPVSLDQFGDLTLMICGVIYGAMYFLNWSVYKAVSLGFVIPTVAAAAKGIAAFTNLQYPSFRYADAICDTFLTHISCCLMLLVTILPWYVIYGESDVGFYGAVLTTIVFYVIFLAIGDKKRLIRSLPPKETL